MAAKACVEKRKLRDPKTQHPSEAKPGLDIAQFVFVGDDARGFIIGGSFHALDFEGLSEGAILTTQANIFGLKNDELDDEEERGEQGAQEKTSQQQHPFGHQSSCVGEESDRKSFGILTDERDGDGQ